MPWYDNNVREELHFNVEYALNCLLSWGCIHRHWLTHSFLSTLTAPEFLLENVLNVLHLSWNPRASKAIDSKLHEKILARLCNIALHSEISSVDKLPRNYVKTFRYLCTLLVFLRLMSYPELLQHRPSYTSVHQQLRNQIGSA